MTNATVTPLARFPLFTSFTVPQILAGGLHLGTQTASMTYMPHPDGQGDVTWQGAQFGLTAPAGANITYVSVTVSYRVSGVASYSGITAQLYAGASPVGSPATFTPSIGSADQVPATGTVVVRSGFTPATLPNLAVQVTFHSAQAGLAYVYHAYATAEYSFANSVGIITVSGKAAITGPALSVHFPSVRLISAGTAVQNYAPAFGKPVTSRSLLIGWTFSNSSSASFDTTCSTAGWLLANTAGGAFAWRALWYKLNAQTGENPPVFSSAGATTPMSQLYEFTNAGKLDQSGGFASGSQQLFTMSASAPDTASGDMIAGIMLWSGSGTTPATPVVSGTDSSGTPLALWTFTNSNTSGQVPFAFSWGQASPPAGPGESSMTGTLSEFDFGGGVIASFKAVTILSQGSPYAAYASAT